MDPSPFTVEEKRFILAEMIKASTVNVEALVAFIREQSVRPSWMHMQIPHGRNMSQCMQIFDQLSTGPAIWNHQDTVNQCGPTSSRFERPTMSPERDYSSMPPVASMSSPLSRHLLPLAPRPSLLGGANTQPSSRQNAPVTDNRPARKRGRPSKADMAKRDLRPNLPKPLAPRPSDPTRDFHPILPAPGRARQVYETTTPESTPPAVAQPSAQEEVTDKKRRRLTAPAS